MIAEVTKKKRWRKGRMSILRHIVTTLSLECLYEVWIVVLKVVGNVNLTMGREKAKTFLCLFGNVHNIGSGNTAELRTNAELLIMAGVKNTAYIAREKLAKVDINEVTGPGGGTPA
ncbi:hypothetical protein P879_07037 [Paragonimus westermani]|uniref:Uncharacterized protein n=1 Tax=Paragonimus westermani TaxID=34504 RepID=A0A8T0DID9_9TREM|nr:hypothetical protein P879_07037 [Paragonimus westermani]